MAAAIVESSVQRNITKSPVKMVDAQSVPVTPEPPQPNSTPSDEKRASQQEQSSPGKTEIVISAKSSEDYQTGWSPQDTTANIAETTQPDKASQEGVAQTDGENSADSESDDEPVPRSRPRARRLALDSDEEREQSPGGVREAPTAPGAAEEADADSEEKMVTSPAPARGRVRRLALDSDSDSDGDQKADGSSQAKKDAEPVVKAGSNGEDSIDDESEGDKETSGVSKAFKKIAKAVETTQSDGEDSGDEKKREEKTMRRLMALGDSSSEDETPRPQSVRAII